jgi:tRNA uridine 5-carbamoylmethylation protein Kti12
MIFAEASNSEVGSFMNVLALLVGIVGGGFAIYAIFRKKSVEIEPQPIETRRAPKRFNFEFWDERHNALDRRIKQEREDREKAIAEIQKQRAETLTQINLKLAEADEARREIHKRINQTCDQMSDMPGKIVADILNAKKLFGDK